MCKNMFNKLYNNIFNKEGKALTKNDYLRNLAVQYAWRFIGVQYLWGGNTPIAGFDCEGFASEPLEAMGLLPDKSDYKAQGLYNKFKHKRVSMPKKGCLVFFGKDEASVSHVGFCIDEFHMLEAGGGGSDTTNVANAVKRLAFVKMRPISRRTDIVAFVDPFKT